MSFIYHLSNLDKQIDEFYNNGDIINVEKLLDANQNKIIHPDTISNIFDLCCRLGNSELLNKLSKIILQYKIPIHIDGFTKAIKNLSISYDTDIKEMIKVLYQINDNNVEESFNKEWNELFAKNNYMIDPDAVNYFLKFTRLLIFEYLGDIKENLEKRKEKYIVNLELDYLENNGKLLIFRILKNDENNEKFHLYGKGVLLRTTSDNHYYYGIVEKQDYTDILHINIENYYKSVTQDILISKYKWTCLELYDNNQYKTSIDSINNFIIRDDNDTDDSWELREIIIKLNTYNDSSKELEDLCNKTTQNSLNPYLIERLNYDNLNDYQKIAIKQGLNRRITTIIGPPGTGKTFVAGNIILRLFFNDDNARILCTADSNAAVDAITEKLDKEVKKIKDISDISQYIVRFGKTDNTQLEKYLIKSSGQLTQSDENRLNNARIICVTCGSSNHYKLQNLKNFNCILFDESSQTTEPSTLIPFNRKPERLIYIGDEKQLQPTVINKDAIDNGLKKTLFNRLIKKGCIATILQKQYRMPYNLYMYSSFRYYKGLIDPRDEKFTDEEIFELGDYKWPHEKKAPILFINDDTLETKEDNKIWNYGQIGIVTKIIEYIDNNEQSIKYKENINENFINLKMENIGIICTYKEQVNKLKNALKNKYPGLEIASVDGFQGKEKDLIIFSTVRSSNNNNSNFDDTSKIGFMKDYRRLNVALTRAKRGMIIIGNSETLKTDKKTYGPFIDWCEGVKLIYNMNDVFNNNYIKTEFIDNKFNIKPSLQLDLVNEN